MWGQVFFSAAIAKLQGIIPTRVGTRSVDPIAVLIFWDHPHACGDKRKTVIKASVFVGSSPRVWGQASSNASTSENSFIIPTRVGTSQSHSCRASRSKDHPHACGDKSCRTKTATFGGGSSPRVWGQVVYTARSDSRLRIIPTRVGTSVLVENVAHFREDHPHACGDKCVKSFHLYH